METQVYPKGPWNVRIKCSVEEFLDAWVTVVANCGNYGEVAKIIGCEVIDVQFAEVRLRLSGVKLPKLRYADENDDRVVTLMMPNK